MALYLGSEKVKLNFGGVVCHLILPNITKPSADRARLLSFDGFVLKDSKGRYLVPKEDK